MKHAIQQQTHTRYLSTESAFVPKKGEGNPSMVPFVQSNLMGVQHRQTVGKLYVALLVCIGITGCVAPSNEERRSSYVAARQEFKGDFGKVGAASYHFISVEADVKAISVDPRTGRLSLTFGEDRHFKESLCVGIDASGYLMTAAHAVGKFCYVLGNFDGEYGFRRARIVKVPPQATQSSDFAVLKVDSAIHSLPYAKEVALGQLVFAVVFVQGGEIGGSMDFAAGRIKDVQRDPMGFPADLVDTSVPLRSGDSGGPLVNDSGALIGVTQGWQLQQTGILGKYRRWTCRPGWKVLETIINTDRAIRD